MFASLLISLAPAALPAPHSFSQDSPAKRAAELVRRIDDAHYEQRVERYAKVAELNKALPVPDPKVTKALAGALVDDAFYVREAALPFLLEGQDPGELVKGLLEGVEQFEDDVADIAKRLVFLGQTAGRGEKNEPGFGEDDQRAIQASMIHAASLYRALALTPDKRTEKALVATLGASFKKQPAFVHLCAFKGCLELRTGVSLGAAADFLARLEKALAKGKIEPHIPRGGAWIGYGQLEIYGELREGHFKQALEDLESFHATLTQAARDAAEQAAGKRDWDAWLKALEPGIRPKLGTLAEPLNAEWEPTPDELLALMKPDWSWR